MANQVTRRRAFKAKAFCVDNTKAFCKNSTLHGLKYLVDNELSIYEKCFFGMSIILVMIIAANLISNVYAKWQSTPVIVGLSAIPTYITKSPFPAVTICNLNQAMKSKVIHLKNDSLENSMLQILCNREVSRTYADSVEDWSIIEDFITGMAQPCEKMLLFCRFGSVEYNCSEIFQPVLTDEGLCCSFNMVHPSFMYFHRSKEDKNYTYSDGSVAVNWDPEKGYLEDLPPKFYPRVSSGTGESLGLVLILDVDLQEYYCSSSNGPGFKISLHSPTETPNLRETGLLLQAGYETKMRIGAVKSEAGNELRDVRQEYRQCVFSGESRLLYYSFYTKRNCEVECDAKLLITYCGCVSYYLPRLYPNATRCGIKDLDCVDRMTKGSYWLDYNKLTCHDQCLQSCFDLTFLPDFFSSPISHTGFSIKQRLIENMTDEYVTKNIAMALMYFKENTFRSSVKTQFIGITDFLSNTGGLMGLFMGFSFISLAEFVYYAFMRPIRRSFNRRQSAKSLNSHRPSQSTIKPRPLQTPPLDYTPNKRHYNYRSRLGYPPAPVPIIHYKGFRHNTRISTNPPPPYPFNN